MRGRKPKPTHLKVLEGNVGHRRLNSDEPRPGLAIPTCPQHLCPAAKAEWKRLARQLSRLGILTILDRAALAAYCQSYGGRWVEAERKLSETPALLKMPSGYVQQNPWLTIAGKQLELMHKYLSEFGLSPVARSRVTVKSSISLRPKPWEFGIDRVRTAADEYLSPRA